MSRFGIAAASEALRPSLRPRTTGPDWQNVYTVAPVVLILGLVIAAHQWRRRRTAPQVELRDEVQLTWPVLEAWVAAGERAESSVDFFRHRPIASRIARLLEQGGQSVALLGPVGSGKSTILGGVRAELAAHAPNVIVASFDKAVDRGLQIDPENGACLFLKASVLSFKGRRSEASRIVESLLHIDPHHAPGLALYESLQREAGVRDFARLSLQTNPSKSYVKSEALNDILRGSVAFRWVVAVDRIGFPRCF